MASSMASPLFLLITIVLLYPALASATLPTAPAFIWSDHRISGPQIQGAVDYRVHSPPSLVETLMQQFGWSNLLCSHIGEDEKLEMVMAFIGSQLRSEDISGDADANSAVLHVLKESFSSSNYSMAFPYVALPTEKPGIAKRLLSSIKDSCELKSRPGKTVIVGSCIGHILDAKWLVLAEGIELVDSIEDIKDFIDTRKVSRTISETDIMFVCPASSLEPEVTQPEGDILAMILLALRQSGTSNVVLYASDPFEPFSVDTFRGRLLSSNSSSSNSTCDEVCETIAGFYEGLIVAITLLIILISGLCCMMGIDTPTRFEALHDS